MKRRSLYPFAAAGLLVVLALAACAWQPVEPPTGTDEEWSADAGALDTQLNEVGK